jgi:hypothetical protein
MRSSATAMKGGAETSGVLSRLNRQFGLVPPTGKWVSTRSGAVSRRDTERQFRAGSHCLLDVMQAKAGAFPSPVLVFVYVAIDALKSRQQIRLD